MKKLVIGILAHVDAGKTTLSESMLYLSGKIRRIGRVDNKDAYLDTFELEKKRGITIFSKQAIMQFGDVEMTLLDTPGHVDFSAEMERTLQVLDYAILVVSGADGVQGHTKTLWNLLEMYDIPTFIFVNKMDQNGTDKEQIITSIKKELSDQCVSFEHTDDEWYEQLALCNEALMESYLDTGLIQLEEVRSLVCNRSVFPVYFGSALRQEGTEVFVNGISRYSKTPTYPPEFAAKVFKITRDQQGNRLTHVKLTGGSLKVKDTIQFEEELEKVNQIRLYSGEKFESVPLIEAGAICALTGLSLTKPGQGLGNEAGSIAAQLEPVLSYQLILPQGVDERQLLPQLRELEEEEPTLKIVWNEVLQAIHVQIMGAVQIEILQSIIHERYGVNVDFGQGEIVYKETINTTVEGVGHFEPLRHYAEVHLVLEPLERGSGIQFENNCSEDILDRNWQRLVMTHLKEKEHTGVLTGAYITDLRVSLVTGRGHNKHTAGGDFREATFRALRQGLKEAKSILLEPYYKFRLEIPEHFVGRAMTDIDKMHGQCTIEKANESMTILKGTAPVSAMKNYQQEINAYTKGFGKLYISIDGYDVCHNSEEIIDKVGYDSERDIENPTGSVFCAGGSGYFVPWDEVKNKMHVERYLKIEKLEGSSYRENEARSTAVQSISLEEIDAIMNSTYYSNSGKKKDWKKRKTAKQSHYESVSYSGQSNINTSGEEYLLVDGYNMIFDWPELNEIAEENIEAARGKLMDILSNYQGIKKCHLMLVFDAYRVEGRNASVESYHNIQVVYTAEAQTADQYIEKFAHKHKKDFRIVVATSDGLQQVIIRGAGAGLLSARELRETIIAANRELRESVLDNTQEKKTVLEDIISEEDKNKLIGLKKETGL